MSKKIENPDNIYTQQVKRLIDEVCPQEAGPGSVYEDARHYYTLTPALEAHAHELKMQLGDIATTDKGNPQADHISKKLKKTNLKLEEERLARVARVHNVALRLIELCEGETYEETQLLSAKFLGTVMLITRGPVKNFAKLHQRLKPLYKAVLTLRLTDQLLNEQAIDDPYLSQYREALNRFKGNSHWRERWMTEVAVPLITAALLQDIGLQSPDALELLRGKDDELDEFRLLDNNHRKQLLKLNYQHTLDYLKNGLGIPQYIGNDKKERDQFVIMHRAADQFIQHLVKDAFVSKTSVGELLKIPQIYVSIVLSTKSDYSRKSLPKGYLLIEQLAKKGALEKRLAEAFIKIVGYFPQGFGVTFIPKNEKGIEKDHYEFAIVCRLNPKHPAEPVCRIATRNLTYISSGSDEVISRHSNLFFPVNRKKLMRIGKARLIEIMSELSSNFDPENIDDLVPSYWEPHDFFSFKRNQNLWNKG